MHKITIRNLKSPKPVKPHLFNVLIDDGEVYLEIKAQNKENEIISLVDIKDQVMSSAPKGISCVGKKIENTG